MNKSLRKTLIASAAMLALGTGAAQAASSGMVTSTVNSLTGNGAALAGLPGANDSVTSLTLNVDSLAKGVPGADASSLPGADGLPDLAGTLPGLESVGGNDGPLFTTDSLGLNKSTDAKLAGIDLSPTFTVADGNKLMTMANDNGKGKVTLDPDDDGKVSVGVDAKYKGGDALTGPVAYDYAVGYTTP